MKCFFEILFNGTTDLFWNCLHPKWWYHTCLCSYNYNKIQYVVASSFLACAYLMLFFLYLAKNRPFIYYSFVWVGWFFRIQLLADSFEIELLVVSKFDLAYTFIKRSARDNLSMGDKCDLWKWIRYTLQMRELLQCAIFW